MTEIDGPTLRILRERRGKALRTLAELSGMSSGHDPKVLRAWAARVGSVAAGGQLWEIEQRINRPARPTPEGTDPDPVTRIARLVTDLGATDVAATLLVWLSPALHVDGDYPRLHAAVAELALCASRAASLQAHPASVRNYHLVALHAAVTADNPDLRARALIAIARALVDLGDRRWCLAVVRLAEGDERLSDETRMELKTLRSQLDGDPRG